MRLYLVRHGQTAWNAEMRAQGHTDIELDETGLEQARRLAVGFRDVPLSLVISSDLRRASDTARAIADSTGAAIETTLELRERSFGDWEGHHYTHIGANFQRLEFTTKLDRESIRPPNGESIVDVWDRLDPIIHRLSVLTGDTAVVSHGGTCSLLLSKLIHGTIDTSRAFRFSNTSVTELKRRPDGRFQMIRYDDIQHLAELMSLSGSTDGATR
jgi:2,3-bisphosphoglycerate-dependent phosphoglycerate mutase